MQIINTDLERGGLAFLLQGICHVMLDFFHHILDAARVDTAIGD